MNECKFDSLGVMLDCSRNAVMTVNTVKKFIRFLKDFGYNRLYLYVEDTYEIDGEPFFGYLRGRYTNEELKQIDDFAFDNGIEVIPCIQTLSHLNALLRWKRYSEMMDIDSILLVDDERTYALIEKMILTFKSCLRTDKIHIGMDESYELGKGKYRDIHGEVDRTQLFLSHLKKVCGICDKFSLKPLMWSDMFYRIAAGDEELSSFTFDDSYKNVIPENLSLVYWDYYHVDKSFHNEMLSAHKKITGNIIYAGGAWKWTGFVPNNSLGIESNKVAFDACYENDVKDVFITLWGDNGAECSTFATLPSLAYIGCMAHGISDEQEIKMLFKERVGADFDDFMLLELPDRSEGVPCNYVINPSKYQLYNDCFMGLYDSGVDVGDGNRYKELSEKISAATLRAGEYSYIFDTISKFCAVLAIKSEIGIRTHFVYKSKDKDELKKLICDYEVMIESTKVFYHAFKKQWYTENKANGFEIQDIRLGGLIMRMQNCHDRLCDFNNGLIESIPELEEEQLPLIDKKEIVWKWSDIVSSNIL